MNSPGLQDVPFEGDGQKHQAVEILDALQNLLYLIGLDAEHPAAVKAYAAQSGDLLTAMHREILGQRNNPSPAF